MWVCFVCPSSPQVCVSRFTTSIYVLCIPVHHKHLCVLCVQVHHKCVCFVCPSWPQAGVHFVSRFITNLCVLFFQVHQQYVFCLPRFTSNVTSTCVWLLHVQVYHMFVLCVQVHHKCDINLWSKGPGNCQQTLLHRAIDENNETVACFLIKRSAT